MYETDVSFSTTMMQAMKENFYLYPFQVNLALSFDGLLHTTQSIEIAEAFP